MSNYMKKLASLEGAVIQEYNPFNHIIRSPSPSVNFCFGKSHGLPLGFTCALYGPPKGGKTLIANSMVGQLHKDDPDAIVVKFDTEFREMGQMTKEQAALWGIDKDRYICYSVNSPSMVFDRIEHEINALCQDGAPIKLIIIDSITGIQGRRAENATTIETQQIGDHALTLQDGFKRILPVQRANKIAMIVTAHVRAEMDPIEMKRSPTKMAASFGVKHHAEYFLYVEPNRTKDGRKDLLENEFTDSNLKDMNENAEKTGHKIRCCMKDSSLGPKGRMGEFTLDYNKGIVNVWEEIFLLAKYRGILERPNQTTYVFGDQQWVGAKSAMQAVRDSTELQNELLKELRKRDMNGEYAEDDAKAEEESA